MVALVLTLDIYEDLDLQEARPELSAVIGWREKEGVDTDCRLRE